MASDSMFGIALHVHPRPHIALGHGVTTIEINVTQVIDILPVLQ